MFWNSLKNKTKRKRILKTIGYPFIALMVLQGKNTTWKVFWLAQHNKSLHKSSRKSNIKLVTGSFSDSFSNLKGNDMRDRQRNKRLFLLNLFTCFSDASTCYKRVELEKKPFCFLRTVKPHKELSEYSNPLKQEAPDKLKKKKFQQMHHIYSSR